MLAEGRCVRTLMHVKYFPKTLQLYAQLGMQVTNIVSAIEFRQAAIFADYCGNISR